VNDQKVASWAQTPCGLAPDGGPGCPLLVPGRFAFTGGRVYLGDQNKGSIYVLDVGANSLTERRGTSGSAGPAIDACPQDSITGIGNVSDVYPVP
jgi:hypothetical protein